MYTLKVLSNREAVYQLASYIRSVKGVENVYVEVGTHIPEQNTAKFSLHFAIETEYVQPALQEIARLVKLSRFTYVQYHDNEMEEAFETVKFEGSEV
ncbi:DUF3928 family protein [Ectobacillus polymachus]|uniref:DUF3928 family protein n=1 Tax=Ectobacillus polymachus TaxID=1508806 RepID=UPI003A888E48